jgi:hypothetical protein
MVKHVRITCYRSTLRVITTATVRKILVYTEMSNQPRSVKLSLWLTKHYVVKAYGGADVKIHVFLTSVLVGDEWSVSRPSHFTPPPPGKSPLYTLDRRLGGAETYELKSGN